MRITVTQGIQNYLEADMAMPTRFIRIKSLIVVVCLSSRLFGAQAKDSVPVDPDSFKHARVTEAWSAYASKLTFGKGQTLALLDDGCRVSMPEWSQSEGAKPKIL